MKKERMKEEREISILIWIQFNSSFIAKLDHVYKVKNIYIEQKFQRLYEFD